MANNFATLATKMLVKCQDVLREEFWLSKLVDTDFEGVESRKGLTVSRSIPQQLTVADVTPSNVPPTVSDMVTTDYEFNLDQWKKAEFRITEKEANEIMNETDYAATQASEASRQLIRFYNGDLWNKAALSVYGFTGTAGTTPFQTANNLNDLIQVRRVLNRQLAPRPNRACILDYNAQANLLNLPNIAQALQRGDANALNEAYIGRLMQFNMYEDIQVPTFIASGATGWLVNHGGGYAAGATTMVIDAGTNTPIQGDRFSVAGVTGTYVVISATSTSVTFNPSLEGAVADDAGLTFAASHVVNLAFEPKSFASAFRYPGDSGYGGVADNTMDMADEDTKVPLRLTLLKQYHQNVWELSSLWGSSLIDPRRAAIILG